MSRRPFLALAVLGSFTLLAPRPACADFGTYIAVGDSLAFGEYRFQNNPSNGDHRGYVGPLADALAAFNGGVRPTVIDLGVDGETSSSFFNPTTPGNGQAPGQPGYALNTNYQTPFPAQNNLLLSTIASEQGKGHTIGLVTVQIGANDLYALGLDPTFLAKSPSEQQAIVMATLGTIQANDTKLLTELAQQAAGAKVVMLGYYNPFAPFASDPSSPLYPIAQLAGPAIAGLNKVIAGEAAAFGVSYVDLATPFAGHELAYTDVANGGNSHPNATGYSIIVGQLIGVVPEPSGVVLMGLGVFGLAGFAWNRGRLVAAEAH
jgi:lysophospholipase L1-like esterase